MEIALSTILRVILILLGAGGFMLAHYIYRKKQSEVFVCPLNGACHDVVRSDYATFLGVRVETLGMLYYLLVFGGYTLLLFYPVLQVPSVLFFLFLLTMLAFLFSLYLIAVQWFALKQWCTWCLFSAGICTVIFGVSIILSAQYGIADIFAHFQPYMAYIHALAAAVGVGVVTTTDVFFTVFLRDLKISAREKEILGILAQIMWAALGLFVLTGAGLYISQPGVFDSSPAFIATAWITGVLVIGMVVRMIVLLPRMTAIAFGRKKKTDGPRLERYRRLAFVTGPITVVSWYAIFTLSWVGGITWSVEQLMLLYIMLAAVVVLGAQLYGSYLKRK